jgi:hypothetical protein
MEQEECQEDYPENDDKRGDGAPQQIGDHESAERLMSDVRVPLDTVRSVPRYPYAYLVKYQYSGLN